MRLAVLAAVASFPVAAQAETTLTFSTWVPPAHPINKYIFEPWAENVSKETKGNVKIRFLPKPIGAPNQHYDAVTKGQVDVAYSTYGYQPERFLPYLIAELPFLGETAVTTSVALWRTHNAMIHKANIHKDVHLLGVMTHGPGMIHHSKLNIAKPDDLKGQKIRVGGDVPKALVEHMGGVVISQPAPKSYEILSAGIADGIFFPFESVKSFNLVKLVPFTTYVKGGLYCSSFWFAMNQEKWNKLSKADQAAVTKVSGEAFARIGGAGWDRADKEGREVAMANNNKIAEAPPAIVEEVKKVNAKLEAEYATKMDKMGLDGKAVIKLFRDEVAKVEAEKK